MNIPQESILLLIFLICFQIEVGYAQFLSSRNNIKANPRNINIFNFNNLKTNDETLDNTAESDKYASIAFNNILNRAENRPIKYHHENITTKSILSTKNLFTLNKNSFCSIKNCFIPFGVCVKDDKCKCSRSYANLKHFNFLKYNRLNRSSLFINFFTDNFISNHIMSFLQNFYTATYCSYNRKSQFIAFILESIFIIGFGHFYLNRIFHGLLKMILILIILYIAYLMKKSKVEIKFFTSIKRDLRFIDYFYNFLYFLFFIIFLIIHIIDSIMLSTSIYSDGFGFSLFSWNNNDMVMISHKEN